MAPCNQLRSHFNLPAPDVPQRVRVVQRERPTTPGFSGGVRLPPSPNIPRGTVADSKHVFLLFLLEPCSGAWCALAQRCHTFHQRLHKGLWRQNPERAGGGDREAPS